MNENARDRILTKPRALASTGAKRKQLVHPSSVGLDLCPSISSTSMPPPRSHHPFSNSNSGSAAAGRCRLTTVLLTLAMLVTLCCLLGLVWSPSATPTSPSSFQSLSSKSDRVFVEERRLSSEGGTDTDVELDSRPETAALEPNTFIDLFGSFFSAMKRFMGSRKHEVSTDLSEAARTKHLVDLKVAQEEETFALSRVKDTLRYRFGLLREGIEAVHAANGESEESGGFIANKTRTVKSSSKRGGMFLSSSSGGGLKTRESQKDEEAETIENFPTPQPSTANSIPSTSQLTAAEEEALLRYWDVDDLMHQINMNGDDRTRRKRLGLSKRSKLGMAANGSTTARRRGASGVDRVEPALSGPPPPPPKLYRHSILRCAHDATIQHVPFELIDSNPFYQETLQCYCLEPVDPVWDSVEVARRRYFAQHESAARTKRNNIAARYDSLVRVRPSSKINTTYAGNQQRESMNPSSTQRRSLSAAPGDSVLTDASPKRNDLSIFSASSSSLPQSLLPRSLFRSGNSFTTPAYFPPPPPPNKRSCIIRVRNAVVFKRKKLTARNKKQLKAQFGKHGIQALEIIIGSPSKSVGFFFRIDMQDSKIDRPVFLRSVWEGGVLLSKAAQSTIYTGGSVGATTLSATANDSSNEASLINNDRRSKHKKEQVEVGMPLLNFPITYNFRHRPVLFIPHVIFQMNFYHALIGPQGVVQLTSTRGAIDHFYATEFYSSEGMKGVKGNTGGMQMKNDAQRQANDEVSDLNDGSPYPLPRTRHSPMWSGEQHVDKIPQHADADSAHGFYVFPSPLAGAEGAYDSPDRSVIKETADFAKGDARWEMARCGTYDYRRWSPQTTSSSLLPKRQTTRTSAKKNNLPSAKTVAATKKEGEEDKRQLSAGTSSFAGIASNTVANTVRVEDGNDRYLAPEILIGDSTFLFFKAISPAIEWFGRGRVSKAHPHQSAAEERDEKGRDNNSSTTTELSTVAFTESEERYTEGNSHVTNHYERMGFCQKILEYGTVTVTEDLWIGTLSGQLGAVWAARRGHRHLGHVTRREAFASYARRAFRLSARGGIEDKEKRGGKDGKGKHEPNNSTTAHLAPPTPKSTKATNVSVESDDCALFEEPAVLVSIRMSNGTSDSDAGTRGMRNSNTNYPNAEMDGHLCGKLPCLLPKRRLWPALPLFVENASLAQQRHADVGVGDKGSPPVDYVRRRPLYPPINERLVVTLEEYASICPMSREESAAHRYGLYEMKQVLERALESESEIGSAQRGEKGVSCHVQPIIVPASREGRAETPLRSVCPLVVGRGVSQDIQRTRGIPEGLEFSIVDALFMPPLNNFDGVDAVGSEKVEKETLKSTTSSKESECGNPEGGLSCATICVEEGILGCDPTTTESILIDPADDGDEDNKQDKHRTFDQSETPFRGRMRKMKSQRQMEELNFRAGLAPCALGPQRERPFLFQGLTFSRNTSVFVSSHHGSEAVPNLNDEDSGKRMVARKAKEKMSGGESRFLPTGGNHTRAQDSGSHSESRVHRPLYEPKQLERVSFDSLPIIEQYRRIRAADLFIVEEGAPAAWAFLMGGDAAHHGDEDSAVHNRQRYPSQATTLPTQPNQDRMGSPRSSQSSKIQTKLRQGVGRKIREVTVILVFNHNYERYLRTFDETLVTVNGVSKVERVKRGTPLEVLIAAEFFLSPPEITRNVRVIAFIYQQGRLPSFAKLREAYDRPWRAETILIGCECETTRVALYKDLEHLC